MTAGSHSQEPPRLFTMEKAAEILRVKKSWLERQAAARKIPFTMLGRSYRFTSAHLDAIVKDARKGTCLADLGRGPRHPLPAQKRRATGSQRRSGAPAAPAAHRPAEGSLIRRTESGRHNGRCNGLRGKAGKPVARTLARARRHAGIQTRISDA